MEDVRSSNPSAVPASWADVSGHMLDMDEAGQTLLFKDKANAEAFASEYCQCGVVVEVPKGASGYIDGLLFEEIVT